MVDVTAELSDLLLQMMESVCGDRPCVYVAGPLSSSRAFYLGPIQGDIHSPDVARLEADNRRLMRAFADDLRSVSSEPVIDPGLLRVRWWQGRDYGEFFLTVLERFCRTVHFMDGWQYSRGASKEFVRASHLGLDLFDARGEKLGVSDGTALLDIVVRELVEQGVDEPCFAQRLAALETTP